jgi:hypothetical protein
MEKIILSGSNRFPFEHCSLWLKLFALAVILTRHSHNQMSECKIRKNSTQSRKERKRRPERRKEIAIAVSALWF